jgi:hypothetical protein
VQPSKSGGGASRSGGSASRSGGSEEPWESLSARLEAGGWRREPGPRPDRDNYYFPPGVVRGKRGVQGSPRIRQEYFDSRPQVRQHLAAQQRGRGGSTGAPRGGALDLTSPTVRGGASALLGFLSSAAAAQSQQDASMESGLDGGAMETDARQEEPEEMEEESFERTARRQERSGSVDSIDTAATLSPRGSPGLPLTLREPEPNEAEAEAEGSAAAVAIAAAAVGEDAAQRTRLPTDAAMEAPAAMVPGQRQSPLQQLMEGRSGPGPDGHKPAAAAGVGQKEDEQPAAAPPTAPDASETPVAPGSGGAEQPRQEPPSAQAVVAAAAEPPAAAQWPAVGARPPPGSPPPRVEPQQVLPQVIAPASTAEPQQAFPQVIAPASTVAAVAPTGQARGDWATIAPPDEDQQGGVSAFT